jgi:hypothetical protein
MVKLNTSRLAVLLGVVTLGLAAAMPASAITISWSSDIFSNTAANLNFGYFGPATANEAVQFDYNTTGLYFVSSIDLKLPGTAQFDTGVAPSFYQQPTGTGTGPSATFLSSSELTVSFPEGGAEEGFLNDFGFNVKIENNPGGVEMLGPNPFSPGLDNGTGNGVDTTILNGATVTLTFSTRTGVSGPSPLMSTGLYAPPGGTPPGTSSTGNSLVANAFVVPEGGSLALFGLGVCGSLLGLRRRRA